MVKHNDPFETSLNHIICIELPCYSWNKLEVINVYVT